MVMRAVEGIRVDDETLAYDLIKKVGPGGHFVSARHTRRHMRSEQYFPELSDRQERDKWKAAGEKAASVRATEKVVEILNKAAEPTIPSDIRKQIKREIPGLRSFVMD
jgi:trimethylamine--corrinoid protein Co-methyltransferase